MATFLMEKLHHVYDNLVRRCAFAVVLNEIYLPKGTLQTNGYLLHHRILRIYRADNPNRKVDV